MTPTDNSDRTVVAAAGDNAAMGNGLAPGTRMGEFEINGLVGEGGFGIVYLAYDHSLERRVALKEYMPSDMARRAADGAVTVRSERHAETFGIGLRSFVNEARLLARFDHPSLVKVYRFWEANGTAYMVMPYYEGVTLSRALRELAAPPDERWLKTLLSQVLDALEVLHAERCYHRDIAPDNILMLPEGTPVLLDFGAARRVLSGASNALTVILKPGYAPIEQYAEDPTMNQGPWTDLYALASVAHFAIMGRPPVPATARVLSDRQVPLVEAAAGRYSDAFLSGIDAALSVRPEDRPLNITEFRDALGCGPLQSHPALRGYGTSRLGGVRTGARTAVQTEPSVRLQKTAPSALPSVPTAAPGALDRAQLEKLLAHHIGPLARIIIGRASKTARTDQELLRAVAEAIDDEAQRAAFARAAATLMPK